MSLDVYRGLTVFGMILADQMYDIEGACWWLIHPAWNGLTCADLVFPSFLFIMGVAIPLAVSKGRPIQPKNIIRVFALFFIGVLLNFIIDFHLPTSTPLLIHCESWAFSSDSAFATASIFSFTGPLITVKTSKLE